MSHYLYEDKRPKKLFVAFAPKISKEIELIDEYNYNKGNIEAISQWHDYIDGLIDYISTPIIALDYTNKYHHFPNGAIYLKELDYDVAFFTSPHKVTNKFYVYIFKVNLKPDKFGLKIPESLSIKEDLSITNRVSAHLSTDEYCKILLEKYDRIFT